MDNNENVTVNTEQIMRQVRREIMEAERKNIPSFDEVRNTAGLTRTLDYLQSNNQLSYYFPLPGGKLKVFFKKVVRKLIKCVLFPLFCHQNILNQRYTEVLCALQAENQAMKKELAALREAVNAAKEK